MTSERHGGVGGMSGSLTAGSLKTVLTIVRDFVKSSYEMIDIGAGSGIVLLCSLAFGASLATGVEVKDDGLQHVLDACLPLLRSYSVSPNSVYVQFGRDVASCTTLPTLQGHESSSGLHLPRVVFSFCDGFNIVDREHCFRLVCQDASIKMFVCSPGKGYGTCENGLDVLITNSVMPVGMAVVGLVYLTRSVTPVHPPKRPEFANMQDVMAQLEMERGLRRPPRFRFTTGDCFFDSLSYVLDNSARSILIRGATITAITKQLGAANIHTWRKYGYDINNSGSLEFARNGGMYVQAMHTSGEIWASSFMVDTCAAALRLRIRIFSAIETKSPSGSLTLSDRFTGPDRDSILVNLLFTGAEEEAKGHFELLISTTQAEGCSLPSGALSSIPMPANHSADIDKGAIEEALMHFGHLGLYRSLRLGLFQGMRNRGMSMKEVKGVILSHAQWHFGLLAMSKDLDLEGIAETVARNVYDVS
ncbi:hypothetical protein CEUSTIGMA_g13665.t1 [Chlamydomonas eustigma]|uniref:Uncharacterized protein n=1 Tax=Chlamydomonas eustigma TaxID=1157962 RepID=A0A250XTB5_9CHLO|nr:hypothetical protein CEUSTIGMA_g13665.t1 [Chlamydomonas eustigma]|eukprot:GAX86253.1 hypothetical protein CEUSTIGMA_g13665.t1 [Chlamydomonas eustigma]